MPSRVLSESSARVSPHRLAPELFEALERRILSVTTFDISGVQALTMDQPQIHDLCRQAPGGEPLVGTGPDDGIAVKAYPDTVTSSFLFSQEQAEALGLEPAEFEGETIIFSDVGVAGTEDFYS